VVSLPVGPLRILHGFYLVASALMLGLHVRHGGDRTAEADPVAATGPDGFPHASGNAVPGGALISELRQPTENAHPYEITGSQPTRSTP
jgi:hypothetical protein